MYSVKKEIYICVCTRIFGTGRCTQEIKTMREYTILRIRETVRQIHVYVDDVYVAKTLNQPTIHGGTHSVFCFFFFLFVLVYPYHLSFLYVALFIFFFFIELCGLMLSLWDGNACNFYDVKFAFHAGVWRYKCGRYVVRLCR